MSDDKNKEVKKELQKTYLLLLGLIILMLILVFVISIFSRIDDLLYLPKITPAEWCEEQPCVKITIFSQKVTIVQPTSTILVYALGIIAVFVGLHFIRIHDGQQSLKWWGISIVLWGLDALFAGTSYQMFGYELKCSGRDYCIWTSGWEIAYLLLSVASINAIVVAQAYSCVSEEKNRKILKIYAIANMVVYIIIIMMGVSIPVRFLISFEFSILFIVPSVLYFFISNSWRYVKEKNEMDMNFIIMWLGLGVIMIAYFLYLVSGLTQILWSQGIWFSENDVLHIGLAIGMVYVYRTLPKYVRDI